MNKIVKQNGLTAHKMKYVNDSSYLDGIRLDGFLNLNEIEGADDITKVQTYADSLKNLYPGKDVMFDFIDQGNSKTRAIGYMYNEGSYGAFIIVSYNSVIHYKKRSGSWTNTNL